MQVVYCPYLKPLPLPFPQHQALALLSVTAALYMVGPHKEGGFHTWLTNEFTTRGWMLELQAPQGPYTNVLDLQVFPAMSKRHSELLQVHSNTEADKERIWKIALACYMEYNDIIYGSSCFFTCI